MKPLPEHYCGYCHIEFEDYRGWRWHRIELHGEHGLPRSEEKFKKFLETGVK